MKNKYNENQQRRLVQLFNDLYRSFYTYSKKKDSQSYTQLLNEYRQFWKFFRQDPNNEIKCLYILFSINKFLS